MRHHHRSRSRDLAPAAERKLPQNRRAWSTHPRVELISDGVIAGYIHDISTRYSDRPAEAALRRHRGDQR